MMGSFVFFLLMPDSKNNKQEDAQTGMHPLINLINCMKEFTNMN